MIPSFCRHPARLVETHANSEPAISAVSQGVDIQPAWANGAKIFVERKGGPERTIAEEIVTIVTWGGQVRGLRTHDEEGTSWLVMHPTSLCTRRRQKGAMITVTELSEWCHDTKKSKAR